MLNFHLSFLVDGIVGIPVSNALSCVSTAGTEVGIVSLPSPPPGAEGGNWGQVTNIWTLVKVCNPRYMQL